VSKKVKIVLKISKDENKENPKKLDFPPTYNEVKEGKWKLNK
jgi:hypothetical protein